MPRVLLLLPTTTYRTQSFVEAAQRLGVDVTIGSEKPSTLTNLNPTALLTLRFDDPAHASRQAAEFAAKHPIDAVVPVDGQVVAVGAAICELLGLRHNSVESIATAENKHRMRQVFEQAGVPSPEYRLCSLDDERGALANGIEYPCVVKPLALSASQGVIRADNAEEFLRAVGRLETILNNEYSKLSASHAFGDRGAARISGAATEMFRQFLVESFVDGVEVALEGILTRGKLRTLALFDKPDRLDGPFFEETIYVTPSRLPSSIQKLISESVGQAVRALGLTEGPVHAEVRLGEERASVIEVNPRSIGGLCSRVLRFGTGMSLEELIIHHALQEEFDPPERECRPSGVMMIPIPREGSLQEIRGLDEAKAVSGVEDVTISAYLGQHVVPLPEGSRYLGFIFVRADSSEGAEKALRESHAQLEFVIQPLDETVREDRPSLRYQ